MRIFDEEGEQNIVFTIQDAEQRTSGEIRVHVARRCRGSVYDEAVKTFEKLGMVRTAERNGVLIYLALKSRQFAVIGDIGIHDHVGPDFWEKVCRAMEEDFRRGRFVPGLIHGIKTCGEELAKAFPRKTDDRNELPDSISSS